MTDDVKRPDWVHCLLDIRETNKRLIEDAHYRWGHALCGRKQMMTRRGTLSTEDDGISYADKNSYGFGLTRIDDWYNHTVSNNYRLACHECMAKVQAAIEAGTWDGDPSDVGPDDEDENDMPDDDDDVEDEDGPEVAAEVVELEPPSPDWKTFAAQWRERAVKAETELAKSLYASATVRVCLLRLGLDRLSDVLNSSGQLPMVKAEDIERILKGDES